VISDVHLPLLVSLLLAGISPALAGRLSPTRAAAALVAAAAAAAAASTTWALVLLAVTLAPAPHLAGVHGAAHDGPSVHPVPAVIAVALMIGLAAAAIRVVIVLRRRHRVTRELRALCQTCGLGRREELVVAPIADPHAFAVPARFGRGDSSRGQILVTVGMLRALNPAGRRALLAHEHAHLAGRHHRQRAVVEVAAALNPLLIPVRAAVAYLVERSADEHAATTIGDRSVAARALVTAALAGTVRAGRQPGVPPDAALAYSRFGVARRVAALNAAPLPERRLPPLLLIALAVLTATQTVHAVHTVGAFFLLAEFVHLLGPGR